MQHTENYQFNLIERDDTFSPDALNENAQALDAALAAETETRALADSTETAARISAVEALDARLAVVEAHRIATGYHSGSGTVTLGFTPKVVFANGTNGFGFTTASDAAAGVLRIVSGGFYHGDAFANCRYVAFV